MWMGILWDEDGDEHALLTYMPHKIFIGGGPLSGLANAAVTLRAAATTTGEGFCELPRCGHCGADLGMPDLDAITVEDPACASS